MSSTTISVVLATYNGDRYLSDQLDSINRQRVRPDELVIGDDGSTDRTLDIIETFRKYCGFPITVIHNSHSGVGTNFLSSFDTSQGRYVAFADQDDVWLPSKLERLITTLRHNEADVVARGVRTVDEALHPVRSGYPNVHAVTIEDRLQGNIWYPIGGNTLLFDRKLLDGCDWPARPASQWSDNPMNHDDLVKTLAAIRGRTVRIPDRLLLYRQHRGNVEGASKTFAQAVRGYVDPSEGISHRIKVSSEWAEYFSRLAIPEHQEATLEYFERAGATMRARYARLHESTPRALGGTLRSVSRGDYSLRRADGLDWRWAFQDLYSVIRRYI